MKDTRLYLVGMLAMLCVGCGGGASSAYRDGEKAELRKDYDTALVNYEKAAKQHPDDSRYLIAEKKARDAASFYHLKQGRRLLEGAGPIRRLGSFRRRRPSIRPTTPPFRNWPGSWPRKPPPRRSTRRN